MSENGLDIHLDVFEIAYKNGELHYKKYNIVTNKNKVKKILLLLKEEEKADEGD